MDCFGTNLTHAQTCDNVRVPSATQRTASVPTWHMPKPVITFMFEVLEVLHNPVITFVVGCFGANFTPAQTYVENNSCMLALLIQIPSLAQEKKPLLLPVPWANIGILTLVTQTRFVALMVLSAGKVTLCPRHWMKNGFCKETILPNWIHLYLWIIVVQYICSHYHQGRKPPRESKEKDLADESFGPHQPERQKMAALITDDGAPAYIAISKT